MIPRFVSHQHIVDNNLKNTADTSVKQILYLWTGKHCPSEVRKQGEGLAHEFSIHLRKCAVESRVTENKEPPHFLQMFRGHLIIFKGKCIDYDPSGSCCVYPNTYMLKVLGNASYNSKAVQISSKSTDITSKDCFIIKAGDGTVWIWCGQCSTGDNREVAKSIGGLLGEYSLAIEANEPSELWQYIPEAVKKKLQSASVARNGAIDYGPVIARNAFVPKTKIELFVCAIDTNDQITTKQILAFTQDDILPEDVYLLDGKNFVYLWMGSLRLDIITKFFSMLLIHFLTALHSSFQFEARESQMLAHTETLFETLSDCSRHRHPEGCYLSRPGACHIHRLL